MHSSTAIVDQGLVHYLHKGEGAPIFLFHASPMSAKSLTPLIQRLSKHFAVIAPDTPGYGHSDPLKNRPDHIREYVTILHQLQVTLGLKKISIYGTATGAQIGIRYAIEYPEQVEYLFLDNTAHFSQDEITSIQKSYFPDLTPVASGQHLNVVWDIVDNLFKYFPWCNQEDAYRLNTPSLPAHVLHYIALDYIRSGAKYDWAYRCAFNHEDRDKIFEVSLPVHIFRWDGSIVKPYTDRIFEVDQPENIKSQIITTSEDRYEAMAETIINLYKGESVTIKASGKEGIASNSIEVPKELGRFFEPEISGQYLLDAWIKLNNEIGDNHDLETKTAIFVKWAQSI